MKFAYQHVSASEHDFHNKFNDYNDHIDSYLSSSEPRSPLLGFIFGFVLGGNWLIVDMLKFNITICDVEGQGKEEDHFELFISTPSANIESSHVFSDL
jgi:hypothetical protein